MQRHRAILSRPGGPLTPTLPFLPPGSIRLSNVLRDLKDRATKPTCCLALDEDGRAWVAKGLDAESQLVAECIGHSLAREFGLDVPDWGVASASSLHAPDVAEQCARRLLWCSAYIDDTTRWRQEFRDLLANPRTLGGSFVLDAVLGITDRHAANLVMERDPVDGSYKAWLIDFDLARVADPDFYVHQQVFQLQENARAVLLSTRSVATEQAAYEVASAMQIAFPGKKLRSFLDTSVSILGWTGSVDHVESVLRPRLENATELLNHFLQLHGGGR